LPFAFFIVEYAQERSLIIDDATTSKRERGSRFGKRPCAGAEIMLMFRHAVEGLG
jgi:hypothetical protein